jgi:hypothetical protein
MSVRAGRLAFVLLVTALASRAVACGGGDGAAMPGDSDAAAEEGGTTGETGAGDAPALPDQDAAGVDATPPPPPTYCNGIVLYASFDQGIAPDLGDAGTRSFGSVGSTTGHFGGALSLVVDGGGAGGTDGAVVFYDRDEAGTATVYPQAEGTLAFWFRKVAPTSAASVLYRPLANPVLLTPGGLVLSDFNARFGLYADLGGAPVLVFDDAVIQPFLRSGDYNHFATSWREANDGGQGALARMVLNGGDGEVFADGGGDAASYGDGAPDDAGNVRVPYRGQTTALWPRYAPLGTLRLGGTSLTTPQGVMDDLVIWNRVLGVDEISALYRSQAAVSVTCKLP